MGMFSRVDRRSEMKRACYILVLAIPLILCLASASDVRWDFSGKWLMNVNGNTFTLTIEQNGSTFFKGTMEPLNHEGRVSQIEGTILPGDVVRGLTPTVIFTRTDTHQHFHGFLFVGAEKEKSMAGTYGFTDDRRDHEGGWFATRE